MFLLSLLLSCVLPQLSYAVGMQTPLFPELSVQKWAGKVVPAGDESFRVPISIRIENTGTEKLHDLQLVDAVAENIAPARLLGIEGLMVSGASLIPDRTFDGLTKVNLLSAGQYLQPGKAAIVRFDMLFSADGHPGPFENRAEGWANDRSGKEILDRCRNSAPAARVQTDCQPALIELPVSEVSVIGLAKSMSEPGPVGDTTLETRISFVVENFGGKPLKNVQIKDDLRDVFTDMPFTVIGEFRSEGLQVDPTYDGFDQTSLLAEGNLLPGHSQARVSVLVQFEPTSTSGALVNRANASAEGTADESTAGDDPDPDGNGVPDENEVTVRYWTLPEPPAVVSVGLAHAADPTQEQPDGRFWTRLRYVAENLGEVALEDLRIEDDLRDAFIGEATFEVLRHTLTGSEATNDSFDGSDDLNLLGEGVSLMPGEHLDVSVEVLFDPADETSPFFNQAEVSGRVTDASERLADLSTLGLNPDPDDDQDPVEAEPTPIPFTRGAAELQLIKSVAAVTSVESGFQIEFHLQLRNVGTLDVRNVQVIDELRVAFPEPVAVIVSQPPVVSGGLNIANDGFGPDDSFLLSGQETLAAGVAAEIRFSVRIELNGAEGPFFNQATTTGFDPDGVTVDDVSDNRDDGGGNGGGDEPTPIDLPANLSLTVLRDVNHNRIRDEQDQPVVSWLAEFLDAEGAAISVLSTDSGGRVLLEELPAGEYQVQVRNPDNGVVWTERRIQLQPGEDAAFYQLVDPSGLVYASDSRMPLSDVVLTLREEDESLVDPSCLLPAQQSQRTDDAGEYRFDLLLGQPDCPEDVSRVHLRIESVPDGYEPAFSGQIAPEPESLILAACASGAGLPCVIQSQNGPPALEEEDAYYLSVDWAAGDEGVANNHLPVDPVGGVRPPTGGSLLVTHEVDRSRAMIGDLVSYTSSVENIGDQPAPEVALTFEPPDGLQPLDDSLYVRDPGPDRIFDTADDEVEPRPLPVQPPLSVSMGELPSGTVRRLDYVTRVTPAVAPGIRISKTTGLVGAQAADSASASLLIEADPLMAETTVIGKVFHDLNEDGIQDPGEPGIAGVRLVTLDGLVIETDSHGRYHVAAVDTGRIDRGTNFMIKLDALSLPQNRIALAGLRQVVRLTPGLMTRINFPVRTRDRTREVAPIEDRTDPFRFEPKLDILALDPITRKEAGQGKPVRFAVFSNYYHHIRRYEIDFYDVSDPLFARQIPPYDVDADRTLPTDLPDTAIGKLELEKHLRTVESRLPEAKGLTVQVDDPQTDLFEKPITLAFGPEVTRIAYRITAYGDCDPVLGEPFDRTGLRLLEVWEKPEGPLNEADLMNQVREPWEIFGHSNLTVQNIPVKGDRNLATRPPSRMVSSETLPGVPPYLTEDIEVVPLPGGGRLGGEVLHATYGLQPDGQPQIDERALAVDEDETWAVFDHEGLERGQRGYVEFDRERIVHAQESGYLGYDDNARGVHRVLLTCGCSRMSAETIIDRDDNALSLRITNYGDLPEKPEISLHKGVTAGAMSFEDGQRMSLGSMPAQTTQEIFLGRFNVDGINVADGQETSSWETAQIRFGVADARGNFPHFRLTRKVRSGEYAADLTAFCENLSARPHTTTEENLLASMIVKEDTVEATPAAYFAMGLINITAGTNDVSGHIEALADDDHFDEDVFVDGRIAGYVKGKILGRYLITAQIDSTEDDLKNLGDNLQARDPRRVFRQLDPDRYYPVYGDDSTTFTDVDSQGAMYLRVEWDKSSALWGNFNTGLTDTEFSQYNRSLYGAKLDYRTQASNQFGEDTFALKVFGSEAQTASAHATYRATGGSLYYLPHRDIVQGSEKLWIEIRARDSEQVLHTEVLLPGRDYEVDDIQGRVILARPLAYLVRERANPIIRDRSLDGDRVYLQVDYEHLPADFAAGDLTTGARAKWSGDRFSIGASSVTERRDGTDYELNGTDLTWRIGQESYVRAEYARSEASQNDLQAASFDGGLTFSDQQFEASEVGGNAWGVELMLDLADLNRTQLKKAEEPLEKIINDKVAGELRAWHKEKDAGFSAGRLGEADAYRDTGFSIEGRIVEGYSLGGGAVRVERGDRQQTIVRVQSEMEFPCSQDRCSAGFEGRYEDFESGSENLVPGRDGEALLIGARLGREFDGGTTVYGSLQTAVAADERYEDNDRVLLGLNQRMTKQLALSLEGSEGDRGAALIGGIDYVAAGGAAVNLSGGIGSGATTQFGSRYTIADGREVYGTHTIDPDRTDGARNLTTLGQRSQLGSRTNIFTETTFGRDRNYADTAHVFGLGYELTGDWLLSANIQSSTVEADDRDIKRQAFSVGTSYQREGRRLASRFEYRRDSGDALDTRQYLTSTRFGLGGLNSDGRWIGKLNLAWTDNRSADVKDGRFVELDIGYAFRPWRNDRWNALAKYAFLYDIGSNGQLGPNGASGGFSGRQLEEQSHVLSAELLHELGGGVELGGKIAGRFGKQRLFSDGDWHDSRLGFAAVRGRYRLPGAVEGVLDSHWEVLAEYRLLKDFEDGGTRHGLLTGLYRSMQNGQIKVGVGFNFTDFDGDLAGTDYKSGGWFVDIIAAY